jgi:hypothetical protein
MMKNLVENGIEDRLKDLDDSFIHELLNVYIKDKSYSYFREETLKYWLLEGMRKYKDRYKSIVYAAIESIKEVIEDIDNQHPLAEIMIGNVEDQKFTKEGFLKLIDGYSNLLEASGEDENNLKKSDDNIDINNEFKLGFQQNIRDCNRIKITFIDNCDKETYLNVLKNENDYFDELMKVVNKYIIEKF